LQAIVFRRFGSPDVLEQVELDDPVPAEGQILVRNKAVAINPWDDHFLRGDPYLMRPALGLGLLRPRKLTTIGSDIAGVVEAVGSGVTRFQPGDEVYTTAGLGAMAELVAIAEKGASRKPANLTFEEAAAVPMAAVTALQALRDSGGLRPGQSVVVNGAGGGVGSFAVQIARALGASEVVGVCGTHNVERVKSLGVDAVVDYTREDFTRSATRRDLLVDTAGGHSVRAYRRAIVPGGTIVIVGAGGGRILGPVRQLVAATIQGKFVQQRVVVALAKVTCADLDLLREWIEAGKIRPLVDRTYALADVKDAFRRLETRHAEGKLVISLAK